MGKPLERPILGNNNNNNNSNNNQNQTTTDDAVNPPDLVPGGGSGTMTDLLPPILATNSPTTPPTPPPPQSSPPSPPPIPFVEVTTSPNVIVTTINSPVIFTQCKQIYITSSSLSEELQPGESITISVSGGDDQTHSGISLTVNNDTIATTTTTSNNLSYITFPEGTSIKDINTAMDGMTFISEYPGRYEFRILLKQQQQQQQQQTVPAPAPTSSTVDTTTTTTSNNSSSSSSSFSNNNNRFLIRFKITVNDIIDITKARQQITENVTQLYTGDIYGVRGLQGQMFVFESTAHDIIMYPSARGRDGPIVSAASFGNGRVIAVPHNLMLEEMEEYGHVSGQFYKNSISWLLDNPRRRRNQSSSSSSSSSNHLLDDAKIVTYSQSIYNWLTLHGGGGGYYTNVIKLESESQLINSLIDADIFIGWLGTSEPIENIDALKEFAANDGGGLFIADYGLGYEYWCKHSSNDKNKNKECTIPGNLLLREAGICFMGGDNNDSDDRTSSSSSDISVDNNNEQPQEQEENPTTIDEQQAIITVTNNNISGGEEDDDPTDSITTTTVESNNVISEMLYDSSSYATIEEFYEGWYRIMIGGLYNSLPSEDYIICELDHAFDYHISTKINPTPSTPVSNPIEKLLLYFEVLDVVQKPPNEVTAHRLAEPLYGIIPFNVPRILHRQVDIDTSRGRWHPTGLYAVPGELVTITVPQDFVNKGYSIRINAHTDDIQSREVWYRFPYVHRRFDIDSTTIEVANAFGGVIFVDLMDGSPGAFSHRKEPPNIGIQTITISNAIEHPYFVLGNHTDDEWITSLRNKPAPYAVLVCHDLIIVQRSSESIELEEPTKLMEWWQKVVTLQDDLAGYYEVDDIPAGRRTSPEIINVDVQISRGAAHAGYPIQASDNRWKNLADVERLTKHGSWGDFHELGHNHQRGWWTFPSDGEVTVNIFSVYCTRTLVDPNNMLNFQWVNDPVQIMREALDAIQQASSSNSNNVNNSNSSVVVTYDEIEKHLPFWIQLVDGFGWEIMKAVFVEYEMDQRFNSSLLPRNAQEEKDQWLIRYSKMSGHDLTQFMKGIWGLEVSDSAVNKVYSLGLPTWLPAMGGITDITAESNQTITFDLVAEALSMDGVVTVGAVTQGKKGNVIKNLDGTYSYIPNEDFQEGPDSFEYSVTSSSGHVHNTTVEIIIETPILVEGTDDESTEPSPIGNAEEPDPIHSKLEDGWQGLVLLAVVLSLLAIVCCLLARVLLVLNRRRGKTMLLTNHNKHKRSSEITALTSFSTSDASSTSSEILV